MWVVFKTQGAIDLLKFKGYDYDKCGEIVIKIKV
jgi:hypothetical protein